MILLQEVSSKGVECWVKMGNELNKSQAKQILGTRAIWPESGKNNFSPYHLFLTWATALLGGKRGISNIDSMTRGSVSMENARIHINDTKTPINCDVWSLHSS